MYYCVKYVPTGLIKYTKAKKVNLRSSRKKQRKRMAGPTQTVKLRWPYLNKYNLACTEGLVDVLKSL